ncbi:MAG: acyl carrier protein [Hyphomicrobiaceae bacterium]
MADLTQTITNVLQRYMRDPSSRVNAATLLVDVGIDALDLPVILLDLEDAFDVRIGNEAEIDELVTLAGLVAVVETALAAKTAPKARTAPKKKSNWMSTSA